MVVRLQANVLLLWKGPETYDLKAMCDNSDSHQLLAVVSTVHHEGVCQAFDDRALCFSESLCCVSASGVGDVNGGADLDVVAVSKFVSIRISWSSLEGWLLRTLTRYL